MINYIFCCTLKFPIYKTLPELLGNKWLTYLPTHLNIKWLLPYYYHVLCVLALHKVRAFTKEQYKTATDILNVVSLAIRAFQDTRCYLL